MWWFLPMLALAKTPEEAELSRLDAELRKLAARNTWSGVERTYLALVTLAAEHGLALTHEQHVMGAQAAQARGDVQEQWARLQQAQKVKSDPEIQGWIAMLEVTHGHVTLVVSHTVREPPTLEVLDPPDPAAMRTIEAARAQLLDRRRFEGLLPLGRYRLGPLQFEVDGGPPQSHEVNSAKVRGPDSALARSARLVLEARPAPTDASAFAQKLAPVLPKLSALAGVESVTLLGPPAEVTYLQFDAAQLEALGSTPTELARGVRDGLGLAETAVVARPTSLVVRAEVAPALLEGLHVPIPGGTIGLMALASMHRGPDGYAPAPGVDLVVKADADREAVRTEALRLLAEGAPEWFGGPPLE